MGTVGRKPVKMDSGRIPIGPYAAEAGRIEGADGGS